MTIIGQTGGKKKRRSQAHVLVAFKEPMRISFLILPLVLVSPFRADAGQLPPEVDAFVQDRNLCDHFRGEPFEGNSPEQIQRREFIRESLEIHCPGTDRRLTALKKRYENDAEIMKVLSTYEERIEPSGNRK